MQAKHLEAFKLIVELGSFTRAAAALHVSQPAISKMIDQLEHDCGFPLFTRIRNQTLPTAEAMMLHSEAERMIVGIRAVRERAQAICRLDTGRLEVFAFPALATHVLPQIICEFSRTHRDVNFCLSSRDVATFSNKTLSHDMDIGFAAVGGDRPGLACEHFFDLEAVCVLPPDHHLSKKEVIEPADLVGERFIRVRSDPRWETSSEDVFERAGYPRNIVAEVRLSEAGCSFVAQGFGVALTDPLAVFGFQKSQLIVRRFKPRLSFDVYLLRPNYRPRSKLSDAFVEFVAERLPKFIRQVFV